VERTNCTSRIFTKTKIQILQFMQLLRDRYDFENKERSAHFNFDFRLHFYSNNKPEYKKNYTTREILHCVRIYTITRERPLVL
jgi:hypothetical protein